MPRSTHTLSKHKRQAKCTWTFMWCVFHTHSISFKFYLLFVWSLLLSFCPLLLCDLSLYHLSFTDWLPFILSSPKRIKQAWHKRAFGLIAILRCLQLCVCVCVSRRVRYLLCVHAHICVFPSYCKFSSKNSYCKSKWGFAKCREMSH